MSVLKVNINQLQKKLAFVTHSLLLILNKLLCLVQIVHCYYTSVHIWKIFNPYLFKFLSFLFMIGY